VSPKKSFQIHILEDKNETPSVDPNKKVSTSLLRSGLCFLMDPNPNEGVGAGCIFIDPVGKHSFLSYRLEFECTNNTVEYTGLVQGLKKDIDLNIKELVVFVIHKLFSDR
jgi:hypothetical protein